MSKIIDDGRPIFYQIAEHIEDDIIEGRLLEESQVPSTNQFASFYKINPATAAKGMNLLVDEGILYIKRGIGMFIAQGSHKKIMDKRKSVFFEHYVVAIINEAKKLDITTDQLTEMIKKGDKK